MTECGPGGKPHDAGVNGWFGRLGGDTEARECPPDDSDVPRRLGGEGEEERLGRGGQTLDYFEKACLDPVTNRQRVRKE
jgi:hypothetical protein